MARLEIAGRYVEIKGTRRVGGQAEVFQATDLDQGGRHVAVKVVPAKSDEIFRIYFERETAALRTLSHPNIASLLDSGVDAAAGVYYVVLRDGTGDSDLPAQLRPVERQRRNGIRSTGFRKLSRRGWRVFRSLRVGMMLPTLSLFRCRRRCRIPIRCRCCIATSNREMCCGTVTNRCSLISR